MAAVSRAGVPADSSEAQPVSHMKCTDGWSPGKGSSVRTGQADQLRGHPVDGGAHSLQGVVRAAVDIKCG